MATVSDRSLAASSVPSSSEFGWRVWFVPPGVPSLRSPAPVDDPVWKPQSEWAAVCDRVGVDEHSPPGAWCTCGIYAATTPARAYRHSGFELHDRFLQSLGHEGAYAYGKVRLLGRVLRTWVNPYELRAERVQLVALYVPSENPSAGVIAATLAREYGVPATAVTSDEVGALR